MLAFYCQVIERKTLQKEELHSSFQSLGTLVRLPELQECFLGADLHGSNLVTNQRYHQVIQLKALSQMQQNMKEFAKNRITRKSGSAICNFLVHFKSFFLLDPGDHIFLTHNKL
jgi:hypothetical protein